MASAFKIESPQGRPAVIAAVMFVIMLLGLGAAYWLVTVRTTIPRKRGEDIIETFRSKKLSEWLNTQPVESSFVFRNQAGKTIGQRIVQRWFQDGRFRGKTTDQVLTDGGWSVTVSTWELADDLSECYYSSSTGQAMTEIVIKGKTLSARRHQKIRGEVDKQSGTAEIPDDYIPDGALPVILRIVAASGETAGFHIAADDHVVAGEKVRFSGITVEPLAPNKVRVKDSMLGGTTLTYHLDDDGEIKQIDMPDHGITITREPKPVSAD